MGELPKCFRELEPHIPRKASSKHFHYYYLANLTAVPNVEVIIKGKNYYLMVSENKLFY